MSKASTAISLVLLTTASTGFIGYKALSGPRFPAGDVADLDNGGTDFNDPAPSDGQPSTRPFSGQSGSSHYNYYDYHTHSPGYSGSNSFSRSFQSDDSHSSSRGGGTHSSGTSRGGFGSTGHAAGS